MPLASQGVQAYDRFAYVNNNPVHLLTQQDMKFHVDWAALCGIHLRIGGQVGLAVIQAQMAVNCCFRLQIPKDKLLPELS